MRRQRGSSMAKPEQHASPDSLLGQLQRGRGEGFIRILSAPKLEASQLLLECISNDPRLDSQVEQRAEYYASIAVELMIQVNRPGIPLCQFQLLGNWPNGDTEMLPTFFAIILHGVNGGIGR